MQSLTKAEYYLWKKKSLTRFPWARQYTNIDFLEYEKKRLLKLLKWQNTFYKTKIGGELGEAVFYVLPTDLHSDWKAAITEKGNYVYKGLSAINNSLQLPFLMLIPADIKIPRDYVLIRILKAKKEVIEKPRKTETEYVVILEDFEELDPDYVFVDVPYEKKAIPQFIEENIISDSQVSNSLSAPLISSPYVINDKGGISLSSIFENSSFAVELAKTLQMMLPPPYRSLPPLKEDYKGKLERFRKGIMFKVAERHILGSNYFSNLFTNSFTTLETEQIKRKHFPGEYSIVCSLIPKGEGLDLAQDMVTRFTATEIAIPHLKELKYADVDLKKAQRSINEDSWIQIVNLRQINPSINFKNMGNFLTKIKEDWKVILSEMGYTHSVDVMSKIRAKPLFDNILRISQSISRSKRKNIVSEDDMNMARKLVIDNAWSMINDPFFTRIKEIIVQQKDDICFNSISALLSHNSLTEREVYDEVKKYFKDISTFQKFFDRLHKVGYIYRGPEGKYNWIGSS